MCVCVCAERESVCVCVCAERERERVCVCAERERESEYFTWSYKIKTTTIHGLRRVQYKSEGVWNTHSKQYIILYTYIKPSYVIGSEKRDHFAQIMIVRYSAI